MRIVSIVNTGMLKRVPLKGRTVLIPTGTSRHELTPELERLISIHPELMLVGDIVGSKASVKEIVVEGKPDRIFQTLPSNEMKVVSELPSSPVLKMRPDLIKDEIVVEESVALEADIAAIEKVLEEESAEPEEEVVASDSQQETNTVSATNNKKKNRKKR